MLRFLPFTELKQDEEAARREEAARLARALGVSVRTAWLLIARGGSVFTSERGDAVRSVCF